MTMTRKALELCRQLGLEAGIPPEEMEGDPLRPASIWQDWHGDAPGGEVHGQWRTMRAIAGGAALGDVACLVRLRSMFGLSVFS
jgi:hypothetical protein